MKVAGKIYNLKDYFRTEFANTPHVYTGIGPDYEEGDIIFTNNGFWDLEKNGYNGFGVWVSYMHPGTGASIKKYANTVKQFIQEQLVPVFEKYIAEHCDGDAEKIIIEDKTAVTDGFRVYYIESIEPEDDEE